MFEITELNLFIALHRVQDRNDQNEDIANGRRETDYAYQKITFI